MHWLTEGPRGRRLVHELRKQRPGGPWTEAELLHAFADSVAWARYWQEPDDVDAALEGAAESLDRIATFITAPPWWTSDVALDDQVAVTWQPPGPEFTGTADKLTKWRDATIADELRARAERPAALDASWSGHWWSTPALSGLPSTSREAPGLFLVEDSLGWPSAEVQPMTIDPGVRVYEVHCPDDWVRLVDGYPLDVSASRRHDWHRAVGAREPLLVPDYRAVTRDWDGIHVSARGYLTTATRALEAASGRTVLAGWNPDQTWWLTDVVHPVRPSRTVPINVG